jgi:hypothetical protein
MTNSILKRVRPKALRNTRFAPIVIAFMEQPLRERGQDLRGGSGAGRAATVRRTPGIREYPIKFPRGNTVRVTALGPPDLPLSVAARAFRRLRTVSQLVLSFATRFQPGTSCWPGKLLDRGFHNSSHTSTYMLKPSSRSCKLVACAFCIRRSRIWSRGEGRERLRQRSTWLLTHLPAPISAKPRRLPLKFPPGQESPLHRAVFDQRTMPAPTSRITAMTAGRTCKRTAESEMESLARSCGARPGAYRRPQEAYATRGFLS